MTATLTQTRNILSRARLIVEAGFWTRGYYARKKDGGHTAAVSRDACTFCAMGALKRAKFLSEDPFGEYAGGAALQDALWLMYPDRSMSITEFNDNVARGPGDVARLFREAERILEIKEFEQGSAAVYGGARVYS